MLFLQNRFGGSYIIKILYCIRFLAQNISPIVASWKHRFIHDALLLGGVFYRQGMSSIKVRCGEWGTENLSKFESINGCRSNQTVKLSLQELILMLFLSRICLWQVQGCGIWFSATVFSAMGG